MFDILKVRRLSINLENYYVIVPSLSLLYYYGLINLDRNLTVKVVGHHDIPGLEFDSYIKSLDQLNVGEPRLLEVDNRCVVPCNTNIRFCITSADVIHSWALSSLSVKLDAISGILSTLCYRFPMVGVFYGQCSEICGANHSFIPIALEVTLIDNFKNRNSGAINTALTNRVALVEEDIKKVVALRTLSQMGFSMLTLGLGLSFISFVHLVSHALFKRCLFIQVGYLIHCNYGQQDGRRYSYNGVFPLFIQVQLLVTLFCLCGLIFSSGILSFVKKIIC
ncbi:cytochrome C oxidase subunit II, periplasmic domain protein [Cooperia oncophora]